MNGTVRNPLIPLREFTVHSKIVYRKSLGHIIRKCIFLHKSFKWFTTLSIGFEFY